MEFLNALDKIINIYTLEVFKSNFKLRCLLSDYIGNDYLAKRYLDALYYLNLKLDIVSLINTKSIKEVRSDVLNILPSLNSEVSIKEYKELVDLLCSYFKKEEFDLLRSERKKKVEERVKIKRQDIKDQKDHETNDLALKAMKHLVNSLPPKVPKVEINKINIVAYAKEIDILYSKDDKFTVLIDNKIQNYLTRSARINHDAINFVIFYPFSNVKVYIPNKVYQRINLELTKTNVYLDNIDEYSKLKIKTLTITNTGGNHFIDGDITNLTISNKSGDINVNGKIKKMNIKNEEGDINLILSKGNLRSINISIYTKLGDINGLFIDAKLKNKIRSGYMIHSPKVISEMIDKTIVNFSLYSAKGKIKFQ